VTVIDLNADVGEEAGGPGGDGPLLDVVTSASVACGFHAGDPSVMRRTVTDAVARRVVVGAHPSYPDRAGFGRQELDRSPKQVADDVLYQVGALDSLARTEGTRVRYVKAHGSLYHRMADDETYARAVGEAMRAIGDLVLLAPYGSVAVTVAERLGLEVATEAFVDRGYLPDGRLAPRGQRGAVLTDVHEVAIRAVRMATDHRVAAVDGSTVTIAATSFCVHGDTPRALTLAQEVRSALDRAGFTLRSFAP
jgi:5-oxoprolinase (ATP-hydrolysing) subunit A